MRALSPEIQAQRAEAAETEKRDAESGRPPTLSAILSWPREAGDGVLLANAHPLASEVGDLPAEARADLGTRVIGWAEGQDKTFQEAITFVDSQTDRTSWRIKYWASALMWFGPALNLALSPKRWADIAASGILFEPQFAWLRRQATPKHVLAAVEACTSREARVWNHILDSTPDPVPRDLIDALAERVRTSEPDHTDLRQIVRRLSELRELEALRRLADVQEFTETVQPYLARHGDAEAVLVMLDRLEEDLAAGQRPDDEDLHWLDGAVHEQYLDQLFRCLLLAYRPTESRSRRGWADPVTPLMAVIRAVGGAEVVRRYDQVLAEEDEVEFLRLQRNAVVEAELATVGLEAAPAAAKEAGVPALSPSD